MDRLLFNAFTMNAPSHVFHGTWKHPASQQHDFDGLAVWTDLIRLLERGRFDALFLADAIGCDPGFDGSADIYLREGIHFPAHDPSILAAALIGASTHIGLTFTSSILQAHPFEFARRISTLDHLSGGRIGWNIVTSPSRNAARNFGLPDLVPHDARYDWADEYLEVVYKLWEGSWSDRALHKDKARGLYADPAEIHPINHRGRRYSVEGPHLTTPSPQRTPFLFQAGASARGRTFAAKHAEAIFIVSHTPDAAAHLVAGFHKQLAAEGRRPSDVRIFQGLSFVIGSTEEEARREARAIDAFVSTDGLAAHVSHDLGIDLGTLDPDRPVADYAIEGIRGHIDFFKEAHPDREPTLGDLVNSMSYNGRIVGTPEQIVAALRRWKQAGIDGINVAYQISPLSYVEFVENLLPSLQAAGLAQREYGPGTLRQRLSADADASSRLDDRHTGAGFRTRLPQTA